MNLKEYFDKVTYKPVHEIGTRCGGKYQGIPFRGTIFNDTLVSLEEGPYLSVHLDLPIQVDGRLRYVIKCRHSDVTIFKK